jgi:tripartite-type tricarboxylate transporter receptor subunit TctC
MNRRHFVGAALLAVAPASHGQAQAYPTRPIRMIVPFAAGGPTDMFARALAAAMTARLGQTIVVDNRAGAAGAVGAAEAKKASADGYTLLFGTASTHVLNPLTQRTLGRSGVVDGAADFDHVAILGGSPLAIAVRLEMPRNLKSLVLAASRAREPYTYGSPGTGTYLNVAMERLARDLSLTLIHVPYKGSAPALQDLIAGQIDMSVDTLSSLLPQHRAGRIRVLGVASATRSPVARDVATVTEALDIAPAFEALLWNVLSLPKGVPAPIHEALRRAVEQSLTAGSPVDTALEQHAILVQLETRSDRIASFMQSESARWQPVVLSLKDQLAR